MSDDLKPSTRVRRLGTTRIESMLGQGGMAEVLRGIQETLERPVAVKILKPEALSQPDALERFRREALALARLQHQNIVAVYDLVEKSDRLYLLMELVDGVDVEVLVQQAPLPLDLVLLIGSEVAAALEHAHQHKVIHRDVKPANVMLSRTGQVKLTDFGIAKDLTQDDLTRQGFIVGTPSYLAPEQVLCKGADARTDLYALGALLYRCLSGQRPYQASTEAELLIAIVQGQRRPLRQVLPGTPRVIDKLITRCMHVDPRRRYQHASELRRDLDRLLAAVLEGSRAGRVIEVLRQRGHLEDIDATVLELKEIVVTHAIEKPEQALQAAAAQLTPPSFADRLWSRLGTILVLVAVLLGLAVLALLLAPGQVQAWLQHAQHALEAWQAGAPP
ncbi:MAG: serine/threonine-protein kinase [Pseudomonadota bacterium]